MPLDLHRLEQLIAVAEEGSVTQAAARLHLSQQALSTSLRTLEREVGVPLLDRSGSRIRVLPAGEALISDARVLRGLASSALQRARRVGRGETEVLHVGHTPAVTGEEVAELVRVARAVHPDLRIEPHLRYPPEIHAGLLDGELDIGLSRAMQPTHGLTHRVVARHRLAIAVSAEHRLADRSSIAIEDLAEETIVVWGEPGRSGYTDLLIALARDAGFEPRTAVSEYQGVPPIMAVIGTDRVAFVTDRPGAAAGGATRVVPLIPPSDVPLIALWLEHRDSPRRDDFLRAVEHARGAG